MLSSGLIVSKPSFNFSENNQFYKWCIVNIKSKAILAGAVNCDYFLKAVLPLQSELNTAVWHELLSEEEEAGEGWKECVRCHKSFIPGSNCQRYCADCGAAAKQARSREKQRRYRERQKTPA